jgi:hypothetical protein
VGLGFINVPGLELKRYGLGQQMGQRVSNLHSCEKTNSPIEPSMGIHQGPRGERPHQNGPRARFIVQNSGVQRLRWCGRSATVMHPSLPNQMLSWSEMAQEGASIHVEEADGDDDAGLIRIIHGDIHVFRLVLGPVDEPGADRCVIAQVLTALRGRLVARRPVGIPEAAFAGRRQMAWGNAERGISMLVEVALIPAILPAFRLRSVLSFVLLSLLSMRFIFPLVRHHRGSHDRYQEQRHAQTPPYDMFCDHDPALSRGADTYRAYVTQYGQNRTSTNTSPLPGISHANATASIAY